MGPLGHVPVPPAEVQVHLLCGFALQVDGRAVALHVARWQLAGGRQLRLDDDVLSPCAAEPVWIEAEAFRDEAVAALHSRDPGARPGGARALWGQLIWAEPSLVASSRSARG